MSATTQITFHQMDPIPSVEASLRRRVEKLGTFAASILGCRVLVEAPHRHHLQGRLYRVRVEIDLPGDQIVVGRSPDEHAEHEELQVAIRDAFRAARRQLQDHVRRRRGQVKSSAAA